jgi:hypothetical protein
MVPLPKHESNLQVPRQLQQGQGGGVSVDSLALIATATLGMASFIVQARLSAKEQKERAALDRAQALREQEEVKAAKQLDRVQQQNAEFVYPVTTLLNMFLRAIERAFLECGCESYMATNNLEWLSPPAQPYAIVMNIGNRKTYTVSPNTYYTF